MLTRIEATTPRGSILNLPLDDTQTGLLVEDIDGLGPVKANITSSGFAQIDGEEYQSSRRGSRNIVITLSLEPDWALETVSDLRDRVYEYFMPKAKVQLRFHFDNRNPINIEGMVESAEPTIFAQDSMMTISLICFNPDFLDHNPVYVANTTTTTLDTIELDYNGNVESGIGFQLHLNRAMTDFSIYMNDEQLDFTGDMKTDDVLKIITEPGFKSAKLVHEGWETSVIYGITPQSKWLKLEPGVNQFRVYAEGAAVPYTLGYFHRYGGI